MRWLIFLFLTMLSGIMPCAFAQYKNAVGVRIGGTNGFSARHTSKQHHAIEGILGIFSDGFSLTGLLEKRPAVRGMTGLYWCYGTGMHVAVYDGRGRFRSPGRELGNRERADVGVGFNLIGELEYVFPNEIPMAVSIGLKPFVEVDSDGDIALAPDPGFGIRYIMR